MAAKHSNNNADLSARVAVLETLTDKLLKMLMDKSGELAVATKTADKALQSVQELQANVALLNAAFTQQPAQDDGGVSGLPPGMDGGFPDLMNEAKSI